jgi:hypothetical protein
MAQQFESYEQVAEYLINQFAKEFGLDRVEPKQEVEGHRSGVTWEIDAKGIRVGNDGFLIVECRRYTTSRLKQEHVAAVAYRIIDTGAKGGIIVSPLDLQEGAKQVAAAEGIIEVKVNPDCTKYEYVLSFLNNVMIGVHDTATCQESIEIIAEELDGTKRRIFPPE